MKFMKKALSLVLCLVMALSCCVTAFADFTPTEDWQNKWGDYSKNIAPAVTMFAGSDESERYIAWYSDVTDGYVELTSKGETKKFTATATAVPDGSYRLGAVLSGLGAGDYTYTCHSGDFVSENYNFTVAETDSVTALYVSDIHMAIEDENENALMERSYIYNETLKSAMKQSDGKLDIILAGGDQASGGYLEELTAMSSPDYMKTIPFAHTVGNHDRSATRS